MNCHPGLIGIALLLAACTGGGMVNDVPLMTFTAESVAEASGKTSLDGLSVLWSKDDAISVFTDACKNGERYSIRQEDAGKKNAAFSGVAVGPGPYYALYPADDAASFDDGVVSFRLPETQRYAAASFASGSSPMLAYSDNLNLPFKNLCGFLELQITGDATIVSIELQAAETDLLYGKAEAAMLEGVPVLTVLPSGNGPSNKLTLDCAEGVKLGVEPVAFYFVLPTGTLSGGFSVSIRDDAGGELVKSTRNDLSIKRARINRMGVFDYRSVSNDFLSLDNYGIYELKDGIPEAVFSYSEGDQLALRSSALSSSFRIQNIQGGYAVSISTSRTGWTVGGHYSLNISAIGADGLTDYACDAVLRKAGQGKLWFEDSKGKRAYIIASEL